ncbi:MAG TPA: hypothetical protein VFM70_09595 [Salinimicrobium sp.]|nr:hypothetical protein [Salinimicrobium sp.]
MKKCGLLILIFFAFSCDDLRVKPLSSDEIFKEEADRINWKVIDAYPAFEECTNILDKTEAKTCFETKIVTLINTDFAQNQIEVTENINDTVYLFLKVDESGQPLIESVQIDSLVTNQLPQIEQWLQNSVDSLPKIHPATKRGIPVTTIFKIPIIVISE